MRHTIWRLLGVLSFWLTWPLIWIYTWFTPARARVLIVNDNSALVVKNWLGNSNWVLPGGGIHKDELPSEAAVREVREELGLVLKHSKLIELGEYISTEKGGLRSKYYLFAAELSKMPDVTTQPLEIMEYAWIDVPKLARQENVGVSTSDALQAWMDYQKMLS